MITVASERNGAAIRADSPIVVSVDNGTLSSVSVTGPGGQLRGSMNPQSSTWTSDAKSLEFSSTYNVRASAVDGAGKSVELVRTLKTVTPSRVVGAHYENFQSGATVGTGMVVRLVFDEPVKNRQQVEKALLVTSSTPIVGAWSWNSDQTAVAFRPQTYWPGSDSVTVSANLKG
ncbi:MAG: Ig-like domain-containing protein, partial [Actinomycetes bacterium]